jgi:hypothetical protein
LGGKKAWRGKSNISPGPAEKKKKLKGENGSEKKKITILRESLKRLFEIDRLKRADTHSLSLKRVERERKNKIK